VFALSSENHIIPLYIWSGEERPGALILPVEKVKMRLTILHAASILWKRCASRHNRLSPLTPLRASRFGWKIR